MRIKHKHYKLIFRLTISTIHLIFFFLVSLFIQNEFYNEQKKRNSHLIEMDIKQYFCFVFCIQNVEKKKLIRYDFE